jgi:hypothetical protein
MAPVAFSCPHCSGRFEAENPPAGTAVACPHCRGAVSPSDDAAGAAREDPLAFLSPPADSTAPLVPFDLDEPKSIARRAARRDRGRLPRQVRRLSREEKARRRARRNLVLMTLGIVVLVVAAVLLSRV